MASSRVDRAIDAAMLRRSHVSSHGSADRDRRAIGVAARARTDSVFQSPDERARLLEGALAWLTAHLDFFDPPQEDAILDVTPEHVKPGGQRKAFGELGLALRLASRAPALRARPDIRRLNDAWLGMARDRRIFFDVRRRVHLVPLLAVALTVCDALDSAPGEAVAALQTVLDRNFLDRTERSAWSQADIAYYLDALGLRHALPAAATLFRRSSLLLSPALPHAQRIDFYATTHLVFHLADFGAREIAGATPVEIARIHDDLGLALSTCLAERDFDLTGEFLIARLCLRGTPGPLDRHAARALCQAQQPSGFVPDRSWLDGLAPTDDAEARARQEFQAVYHPTLVALILLACDMAGDHPGGRVR